MDHHETGSILDQLIGSGKVKAVGVSNFIPHDWTLLQSAMQNQLLTNQIEISVLTNQAFTNGDIAFLQERGIPPMAWSPMAWPPVAWPPMDCVLRILDTKKSC